MLFNINNETTQPSSKTIKFIFISTEEYTNGVIEHKEVLEANNFKALVDENLLLVESNILYIGIDDASCDSIRSSAAVAIRAINTKSYENITIDINDNLNDIQIQSICEGLLLGNYQFLRYKSEQNVSKIKSINICTNRDINEIIKKAKIISSATNFTRDIVNTPPDDCYPDTLVEIAKELVANSPLECNVLDEDQLKEQKMNALLAVARASRHKPYVIHISHKPENPKCVVTLVGKGLTYDSGGLSLKPSTSMVSMKSDKSGASTVMGIMKAVSELNLPIEIHGFIGAVENMIGDAYKPDDVLVAKNGKTIEVRNTDAEGRLVLADVLVYAQQEVQADYIFDFATLTGACVVALGAYTIGIMGYSEKSKELLKIAAKNSGELVTELQFNRHLKKLLKSEIADLSNISSSSYGGAITAGLFLSEFINEENKDKWTHLDIAGPAFVDHIWGENPYGASGAGVRMMISLLEKFA
ncbi:MAG: aminopeptidase A [Sulfurovum sp. AS07-7]|nr:MAG: aminopeptidase A [Sulfurovum sp. AS07-7]